MEQKGIVAIQSSAVTNKIKGFKNLRTSVFCVKNLKQIKILGMTKFFSPAMCNFEVLRVVSLPWLIFF